MNRKISASWIFPVSGKPLKNGILEVDSEGRIINLSQTDGNIHEIPYLEYYSGVLVPGFVNCHCHLELSFLRGLIPQHIGLDGFIQKLQECRNSFTEEEITKAIKLAYNEMYSEGIVAVGDISNSNISAELKKRNEILFHTFVECFGTNSSKSDEIIAETKLIAECFTGKKNLNPHAPYSVSPELFKKIKTETQRQKDSIISLHNQECDAENELFEHGSGKLFDLFLGRKIAIHSLAASGKNSLETVYPFLSPITRTLLVHNVFTSVSDIDLAENYFQDLYWTFCPNSNFYIQNKTANIQKFREKNCKITLGTDSLASNTRLSILEELKTVSKLFPQIDFAEILSWATLNGAQALGFADILGSFQVGKKPGVLLLENFDFRNMKLLPQTILRKLV